MRVLAEIERGDEIVPQMVLIVDVRELGLVGRDDEGDLFCVDSTTRRESGGALPHGRPLRCGPSFLSLLERFPDGDMPPETRCAIFELVRAAPRPASLARLRYDVEERRFVWDLPRVAGGAARPTEQHGRWELEVWSRLLGRVHGVIRPSLDRFFGHGPAGELNVDDTPPGPGERHLGELVEEVLRDEVGRSRELVEQWRIAEGISSIDESKDVELRRKAESLAEEAELHLLAGHLGSARMNMKLATIYANRARYRAALAAMERSPRGEPAPAPWGAPDE